MFGYATFRCFFAQNRFNILFLTVEELEYSPGMVLTGSGLIGLALTGCLYLLYRSAVAQKFRSNIYREIFLALCPLAALSVIYFLPPGFSSQVVYTIVLSITTFRVLLLYPPGWVTSELKPSVAWSILIIATVFFVWQGYYTQWKALNSLCLPFGDWAEYLTIAKNTADGKWFILNTVYGRDFNFLATHFSPGSLLLISLYVKLFPSVKAFFLMNSMILYSCGILTYILSRTIKLSGVSSLLPALAALLFPSLVNLNLCTFNGFHPIYLIIPTLLVFFIFLERNWIIPALAVFLFSLTIKETVPVFWVGMGTVLFFVKYRKIGAGIVVFSILYYFLVMRLIIPSIAGDTEYDYAFRFSHLGSNELEIMLSPVTRATAFWGSLMRPQCFYFILMLLLPCFLLTAYRVIYFCGAGLTLMFVCLQSSNQLQNISMQYQSEGIAMAIIAAVLGAGALMGASREPGYFKFFRQGVRAYCVMCPRRLLCAVLPAVLVSALLASFFWGEHYVTGRASIAEKVIYTLVPPNVEVIKKGIPPGQPLTATLHVAGQFVLRNPLYTTLTSEPGYALLNLWEPYQKKTDIDKVRLDLLKSNKHKLVLNQIKLNSHYMLFVPEQTTSDPDYSKWSNTHVMENDYWKVIPGSSEFYLDKAIEIKSYIVEKKGNECWQILVRLLRKVEYDIDFKIIYRNGAADMRWNNVFGNGLLPASTCPTGTVFEMTLRKPPDAGQGTLTIIPEFRR